ncbi:hypothetical protein ACKLTP_18970, partial [Paenarthrobacter ureafaciens]
LIDPEFHSSGNVPPHHPKIHPHPAKDVNKVAKKKNGRAPTDLLATANHPDPQGNPRFPTVPPCVSARAPQA